MTVRGCASDDGDRNSIPDGRWYPQGAAPYNVSSFFFDACLVYHNIVAKDMAK